METISMGIHHKIVESYKTENDKLKLQLKGSEELKLKFVAIQKNCETLDSEIADKNRRMTLLQENLRIAEQKLDKLPKDTKKIQEAKEYYDTVDNSADYIEQLQSEITIAEQKYSNIVGSIMPYGVLRESKINKEKISLGTGRYAAGRTFREDTWIIDDTRSAVFPNKRYGLIDMDAIITGSDVSETQTQTKPTQEIIGVPWEYNK